MEVFQAILVLELLIAKICKLVEDLTSFFALRDAM